MSQHDLTIDNQGFPAFRADLNNALQALGSTQSGTTAPSPTFANQLWYDTTNNILKIRNEDNDAWISLLTLDQVADAVSVITGSTINAGALTASGNVSFDGGTFIFNETGADKDFRIEGDTNANLFFTDASTDRVGIGTNTPAGLLGIGTEGTYLASNVIRFSPSGGSFIDHETVGEDISVRVSGSSALDNNSMIFKSTGVVELPIGQLKFPASQNASADANTLDDYEEGTWTPTLIIISGTTSGNILQGTYVKIGRQVTVTIFASFPTTSSLVIDGFGGLPFTSENQSQLAVGSIRENSQTGYQWHLRINQNTTTTLLRRYDNSNSVSNNFQFGGTTTYFTA